MQTKDHKILGEYFIKDNMERLSVYSKKAFILGCISPDINIFTYFKGSINSKMMHGHNYLNSKKLISKLIKSLSKKSTWNIGDFYSLGKLIHYIIDSFTYVHNSSFKGTLRQHQVYEEKLHKCLDYYWNKVTEKDLCDLKISKYESLYEYFKKAHKEYEKKKVGFYTDIYFIKNVTKVIIYALVKDIIINEKYEFNRGLAY